MNTGCPDPGRSHGEPAGPVQQISASEGTGPNEDEPPDRAIADALRAVSNVCSRFNIDEAIAVQYDRLTSPKFPHFIDIPEVAAKHKIPVSPPLVAMLTLAAISHWEAVGAEVLCIATTLQPKDMQGDPADIEVIAALLACCEDLTDKHFEEIPDREDAAALSFGRLADTLTRVEGPGSSRAFDCARVACNLATVSDVASDAVDTLASIAASMGEDSSRLALIYRAKAALLAAKEGLASKLEVYDAVERACRIAPTDERLRTQCAPILAGLINHIDYLRPLRATWLLSFDTDMPELDDFPAALAYTSQIWSFEERDHLDAIAATVQIAVKNENSRLSLMPARRGASAHADWNKWSIDHEPYRRAIPLGRSLLKDAARAGILMTLSHEITHLYCGLSHLHRDLQALRVAAMGTEIRLWSQVSGGNADPALLFRHHIAPLGPQDANPIHLSLVEHSLRNYRKAQLLRAAWLPWLEGVAVFAELSGDPTTVEEFTTDVTPILANLLDPPRQVEGSTLAERVAETRAHMDAADRLYSQALTESALHRLTNYLGQDAQRYLPGYLTVRATLTMWRRHLPLNGMQAARLLQNVTSTGTAQACPDLALPVDDFGDRAVTSMIDWVRRVALLDRESLIVLDSNQPRRWVADPDTPSGYKVIAQTAHGADAEYEQLSAQLDQAMNQQVERAGRWTPEPVHPHAHNRLDPDARTIADRVTEALSNAHWSYETLTKAANASTDSLHRIVVIGRVTAPFWIDTRLNRLLVVVRVTEADTTTGEPSYIPISLPLSPQETAALAGQIAELREPRMSVERVVDLVPYHPIESPDRGFGRHVVAFTYGTFRYLAMMGLAAGGPVAESLRGDINRRLDPHDFVALEAALADGRRSARRTIDWLDTTDAWHIETRNPAVPIQSWVRRVRYLAEDVALDDDTDLTADVGRALLRELGLTEQQAAEATRRGLDGLHQDEFADLGALRRYLLKTAANHSNPENDPDAEPDKDLAAIEPAVVALLFEATSTGYDVKGWQTHTS